MLFSKLRFMLAFLCILTGLMLVAADGNAQQEVTVHALLVIMDADPSIGRGMDTDRKLMEELLTTVDRVYEVDQTAYRSSRGQTTKAAVLQWVQNLRPAQDDVVFVYYSGHGGMVSPTDRRTYLNVSGDLLYRDELSRAVESRSGRLKIIITDACSSYPPTKAPKQVVTFAQTVSKRHIKHLFGQHEGVFHVNGASEGQYGYCHSPKDPNVYARGSFFTQSLVPVISDTSDKDKDGFVTWQEVFDLTLASTQELWRQSITPDPNNPQVSLQTPQQYSMARRKHSRPPADREPSDCLWDIRNPNPGLAASVGTEKSEYRIGDYLTIKLRAEKDCYVTLLNWDETGKLKQLFPNAFDTDNFIRGGETYSIPSRRFDFDFTLSGNAGTERVMFIAVRSKADSDAINKLIPNDGSAFRNQGIRDKGIVGKIDVTGRDKSESRIVNELLGLNPRDWAVAHTTLLKK